MLFFAAQGLLPFGELPFFLRLNIKDHSQFAILGNLLVYLCAFVAHGGPFQSRESTSTLGCSEATGVR
jgi:hypothetical protein